MNHDDPFKQFREMNREFDCLCEMARSPIDDMSDILDRQLFAYDLPATEISQILRDATAYRPIAQELLETWKLPQESLDLSAIPALSLEQISLVDAWEQQRKFFEGVVPAGHLDSYLEASPLTRALDSIRNQIDIQTSPLAALQLAMQSEISNAGALRESLAGLHLEKNLAELVSTTSLPEVSAELAALRDTIEAFQPNGLPSMEFFSGLKSLADSLALPYLQIATSQWTSMVPLVSPDVLVTEPLLQATISALSNIVRSQDPRNIDAVISEWEGLVDAESERNESGEIPSWMQGFLINLLFFILALASGKSSEIKTTARFDDLEHDQAAIVERIEAEQTAEEKAQESLELELAAIRQAINALAASVETDKAEAHVALLVSSCNLRLRGSPSEESSIVWIIPKGTPVEIVEEQGEWASVRTVDFASGYLRVGWVASEYLATWEDLTLETAANQQLGPNG